MKRGPYRATPEPGSIADLVAMFRKSPRFLAWAPSTRSKNDRILGDFVARNGRVQTAELTRGAVMLMRDSLAETPGAANNWHKVISLLLAYGVDIEAIPSNPAARIPKLKPKQPDGFRVWREDEIAAFLAHWPVESPPHRALVVMLYTGAAAADAVRLGPGSVRVVDGVERVAYARAKTGQRVSIRVLPPLAEATTHARGLTWLETVAGRARTAKGLSVKMPLWAASAGLGGADEHGRRLCCHGLRKAMGRRLAEAGCTVLEIASILGHKNLAQVETYIRDYDRAQSADRGFDKLGAPRTNVVVLNASRPNRER